MPLRLEELHLLTEGSEEEHGKRGLRKTRTRKAPRGHFSLLRNLSSRCAPGDVSL